MVRSAAVLAFVGLAAAIGIYVAMQKTVIKGEVMAGNLLEQFRSKGVSKIDCDERIPVGPDGAKFTCKVQADDGSTANVEYTMDRAGNLSGNVLDSTGPTERRPSGW